MPKGGRPFRMHRRPWLVLCLHGSSCLLRDRFSKARKSTGCRFQVYRGWGADRCLVHCILWKGVCGPVLLQNSFAIPSISNPPSQCTTGPCFVILLQFSINPETRHYNCRHEEINFPGRFCLADCITPFIYFQITFRVWQVPYFSTWCRHRFGEGRRLSTGSHVERLRQAISRRCKWERWHVLARRDGNRGRRIHSGISVESTCHGWTLGQCSRRGYASTDFKIKNYRAYTRILIDERFHSNCKDLAVGTVW